MHVTGFTACGPTLVFGGEKHLNKGILNTSSEIIYPRLLTCSILSTFKSVQWLSCGLDHCLVISQEGQVFTWGYGVSGVLGHGDYSSYTKPKLVEGGL